MAGTPKAKRAEVAERRTRAIELRTQGNEWADIATALGYSSGAAACVDVSRALEQRLAEQRVSAEVHREQLVIALDALAQRCWQIMQSGDEERALRAVDRLTRLAERKSRLLGLDAPVKVETGTQIRYELVGVDLSDLT